MKRISYFFPSAIADRRKWFLNYKAKIDTYGMAMGYSTQQINDMKTCCDKAIAAIDEADAAKLAAKAKNKAQNTILKDNFGSLRKPIRHMKSHDNYKEAMGETLGVIGTEIEIDLDNVQTKLKATKKFNGVELKFTLKNCDGGNIYSKRKDEKDFSLLKFVTHPQAMDMRPNLDPNMPEERQYLVVLVVNDEEVGKASDIVTETV